MTTSKILIIDDNEDILFTMREALKLKSYEVETRQAFVSSHQVEKIAPSVLFLDFTLLTQRGDEVIKKLRVYEPTKKLPVVIVSGWSGLREIARKAGADDFLEKPFSLDELWKKAALYA